MTTASSTAASTTAVAARDEPYYSMGPTTYRVPLSLYASNRSKLVEALRTWSPPSPCVDLSCSVVYVRGSPSATRDWSDHEPIFRQESYFHYLFGVREPDVAGAIDVRTGRAALFVPNLPREYATIMGRIPTMDEWRELYGVDDVLWDEEAHVERWLLTVLAGKASSGGGDGGDAMDDGNDDADAGSEEKKGSGDGDTNAHAHANSAGSPKILLLSGLNIDSGKASQPPTFPPSSPLLPHLDSAALHPILTECRVVKSATERSLLRYVTEVTSMAHAYTMARTKPAMMEYQSESLFRHYCYYTSGMRHLGYTAICGCGPNGAILHYGHAGAPNDARIKSGDLCLYDMGAEYCCYGSDVTCTFPADGSFTDDQRAVYDGVLDAQRAVYRMLKPGVSYVDCHMAAEGQILRALIDLGVVVPKDKTVEELVDMRLGAVFMPHGLGHFIGIDTHDVGGYNVGCPKRRTEPGLKSLRTARVMEEGMTLTVEPGCYFINHLLDEALSSSSSISGLGQYLDRSVINSRFRGFGGVRLEDVVAITSDGCVNYTLCPRTTAEVEYVKGGGKWPPPKDDAPELKRERLCHPDAGGGVGSWCGVASFSMAGLG